VADRGRRVRPVGAQDIMQWVANELGATVVVREQTNAWAIEDFNQFTEAIREGWIHHTGDPTFRRTCCRRSGRGCRGTGTGLTGRARYGRRVLSSGAW
jgi:hypothetical protein